MGVVGCAGGCCSEDWGAAAGYGLLTAAIVGGILVNCFVFYSLFG